MASRKYRRDKNGRFATSGTVVTMGKAGGFANAGHRASVQALQQPRPTGGASARARLNRKMARRRKVSNAVAVGLTAVAVSGLTRGAANAVLGGNKQERMTSRMAATMAAGAARQATIKVPSVRVGHSALR